MNFDEAIAAHVKWKTRLRVFIGGDGEKLDSAVITKDNACDLGRWIYGEGAQYRDVPAYERLRAEHAHFHCHAADIVRRMEAGDATRATAMLDGAEFQEGSNRTVAAIMAVKKAAAGAA